MSMTSVKDLIKRAKKKSSTKSSIVPSNWYVTEILSVVHDDKNYVDGAITINHKLVNAAGKVYEYPELFVLKESLERTDKFIKHLAAEGIDTLDELIGRHELVRLAYYFTSRGRKVSNIVERSFISDTDFETRQVLKNADA